MPCGGRLEGGELGVLLVQSWVGAQALLWLICTGVPDSSAQERGRCCCVLDAEADTPGRCQLRFSVIRNLIQCGYSHSFAAAIKCATEIKMDLVRIHLLCVLKH